MHIMACIVVKKKNLNYIQHFRPWYKNLKFKMPEAV